MYVNLETAVTGPETGGANEANRIGPATSRNSEVQGGGGDKSRKRVQVELDALPLFDWSCWL